MKLLKPLIGVETGFYGAVQRISLNGVPEEKLMKVMRFQSPGSRKESFCCHVFRPPSSLLASADTKDRLAIRTRAAMVARAFRSWSTSSVFVE